MRRARVAPHRARGRADISDGDDQLADRRPVAELGNRLAAVFEADPAAQVVTNDQVQARGLPDVLQQALLQLNVGQATPLIGSLTEGVRVFFLCGRDDPEGNAGPNRDQLQAQLEDDRIGKRAQRYLRDLRRDAVIEYEQ